MTSLLTDQNTIGRNRWRGFRGFAACLMLLVPFLASATTTGFAANDKKFSDTPVFALFYSDNSCLLNFAADWKSGTTVMDAGVDDNGSHMMIHCDSADGNRLTLRVLGEAIDLQGRHKLLSTEQADEGEHGVIAWLTVSDSQTGTEPIPRRYIGNGQVTVRKTLTTEVSGAAINASQQVFARIDGVLGSIAITRPARPEASDNSAAAVSQ